MWPKDIPGLRWHLLITHEEDFVTKLCEEFTQCIESCNQHVLIKREMGSLPHNMYWPASKKTQDEPVPVTIVRFSTIEGQTHCLVVGMHFPKAAKLRCLTQDGASKEFLSVLPRPITISKDFSLFAWHDARHVLQNVSVTRHSALSKVFTLIHMTLFGICSRPLLRFASQSPNSLEARLALLETQLIRPAVEHQDKEPQIKRHKQTHLSETSPSHLQSTVDAISQVPINNKQIEERQMRQIHLTETRPNHFEGKSAAGLQSPFKQPTTRPDAESHAQQIEEEQLLKKYVLRTKPTTDE